jgi:hypothetical protein
MEKTRNMYRCLVEKPLGKRPFGRPSRRWKDTIKIYLNQIVSDMYLGHEADHSLASSTEVKSV